MAEDDTYEETCVEGAGAEKVPLFKKWDYWYALVIGFLLLCIILFYFLTKHFS